MRNKVQHFTLLRITFFFQLNFKSWPVFINLWKYDDYTNNFNVSTQSVCGLKKIISDYHPVLLFGSAGEDTTVTGLSLNVSESFPKIIGMCLGRTKP